MATMHPAVIPIGQILTLAAVGLGGVRSLQQYVAVLALTPPDDDAMSDEEKSTTTTRPAVSIRQQRSFWNSPTTRNLIAFMILFVFVGSWAALFYSVRRFGSQSVSNILLGCLYWTLLAATFFMATSAIIPFSCTLSYVKPRDGKTEWYVLKTTRLDGPHQTRTEAETQNEPVSRPKHLVAVANALVRLSMGPALATAVLVTVGQGSDILLPLVISAFVLCCLSNWLCPTVSVRKDALFASVYLFVPTFAMIIYNDNNLLAPIALITRIAPHFSYCFSVIPPGLLISLNMRYDYARDVLEPGRLSPGASSKIPSVRELAHFKPTVTLASLVGLATSFATIDYLLLNYPSSRDVFQTLPISYFFTMPCTFGASLVIVCTKGQLRQWWSYSETWLPELDQSDVQDDLERIVGGVSGTERDSLLGDFKNEAKAAPTV